MKKIILTGGGTAGHVTPNLALVPKLIEQGFTFEYIGSVNGIERELVTNTNITYHAISSGKLRRYLSLENVTDMFRIIKGLRDASKIIKRIKPDIIFSKGGFVSVPVVIAGKLSGVPVLIHESDMTPGLANKISIPFATKICLSFPETVNFLPKNARKKAVVTGAPIRESISCGDAEKGLKMCGFSNEKPVILVMGGSLGSVTINTVVRNSLDSLLSRYNVAHICGKNNVDDSIKADGYAQFAYLHERLIDLFACADIIVSRAGSNSIFEFLSLKKPNLLIPLSKKASRGDQILNARSFKKHGFSEVLMEEDLSVASLVKNINILYDNRHRYTVNMSSLQTGDGVSKIMAELSNICNG